MGVRNSHIQVVLFPYKRGKAAGWLLFPFHLCGRAGSGNVVLTGCLAVGGRVNKTRSHEAALHMF